LELGLDILHGIGNDELAHRKKNPSYQKKLHYPQILSTLSKYAS
jgi:hypothetical protein